MEHTISSELTARTGKAQVDMVSLQRSDLSPALLPTDDNSVWAFNNFKKSGVPSRLLLFSEGAWEDVECNVFDELKAGFLAGKTSLKIAASEESHLFDFLRMARIDLNTGKWNSIGWIDVHGKCFFPGDEKEIPSESLAGFRVLQEGHHHAHCRKELCDENAEVSSNRWPDAKLLSKDERFYKVVEKLFLSGMKRFIPDTVITSIYKCAHSSSSANSRLLSFQFHRKQAVETRGHCNIKFGWFGSSASSIYAILSDGFTQTNSSRRGVSVCNHGFGIHLSSPYSSYDSALLSEADENGDRHILLCRVIMGKSEKIEAVSIQDHPSNADFDTGVDDIVNPKWYVVWNTHMRTHIVPDFVVSFRSSGNSGGLRKPMGEQKLPSLTNSPFWKLFAEIGRFLPSSKMQALEIFYNQYKVGEISKDIFIKYLRSIVGDRLLVSSLKRLRTC